MAVLVPFSDIQPKIYATTEKAKSRPSYLHDTGRRRTSSHHYIDLDVTSEEGGEDEDGESEERALEAADPEDPYVSLGAIRRKEERDKCESPLREGGLANCSQSLDDEFGTDYTILRSPLVPGMVPSPSLKSILRFTHDLTESSSYYQVPKNRSIDEDIYIDEDGASSQSDDEELEELKTTGVAGNFPERKSLRSRCPDSLPRNAPPPIPDRSPLYRRESTPITLGGFTQRTASTLGASMVNGLGSKTLSPATPVSRRDTSAVNKTTMMSSLLFEFRARHSVTNISSATVDDHDGLAGLSGNHPIDDIPPPLPPPRQTITPYPEKVQVTSPSPPPPSPPSPTPSSSSSSSPSPPPPPIPSPPSEDGVEDLSVLPIADFPPPLPERSLSLASLSSLTSGVSAASVASVDSVKSATSVESLTSLSSFTGLPMSDSQSFPDSIKTLKANNMNRYPTFSTMRHKRTETLGRMHDKGSVSLGRSVSCLSPHGHRNLAAANRKLPPLPISNKQSEVSPISDYTLEPKTTTFRRPRPFSSENILEGTRDFPPPLPADRSSSMENLLRQNRGYANSHGVPATGPATPPRMSATPSKSAAKVKRQRSYFASNRSRAPTQKPQIPTANIAPRPSPLSNIMLSLSKSHDGAIPRRHDPLPSHQATSTEDGDSDGNSDDDSDDDGDHNYLYPEAPTYDDTETYPSNSAALNVTPPTVPARIAKKSASLPRSCIKNLKDIPVDIATLSCDQIAQALRLLNIRDDIIDKLRSEKMNGELLKSMSEEILRTEFHMSQFHAIKVIKFVNGWRP
ncbi:mucin-2-like isoform X2 [Lytechinus pictus]|uniref:mucin-2-like isoform X2 n=1 Tax=Lytechinus pictus TaxID=7653 RepID=UPI0030BA2301